MNNHCIILTSEFPPLVIGGVGRYVSEVASRLRQSMRVTVALVPTYHPPDSPPRKSPSSGYQDPLPFDGGQTTAAERSEKFSDFAVDVATLDYRRALLEVDAVQNFQPILAAAQSAASQCSGRVLCGENLVIYVQDYALSPIAAALREWFPQAQVFAACHLPVYAGFTYFDKPVSDAIHQILEAKLVHLAHRVVVPSAFAAHVLTITHNVPACKLAIIPLGVCRPSPVAPIPGGSLRLLAVGRPNEQKGYHFLLEAFQRLRQWDDATRLTIVTGMKCCDRLQALAKRHGVSGKVEFEHQLGHDAIWPVYDRHHLLVTTSLYETFGLAVLEAMASGRPALGFSVGALPELWGDALAAELGTRVASVDRLVSRIKSVASDMNDRDALARRAECRAREFSWTRHVERLIGLIRGTSHLSSPALPALP